ncbi:MAG: ROK family protein [Fimbriimonadaceae bacterium]|nr:ROK family protein [Fimbriimonadaceae bacterium]
MPSLQPLLALDISGSRALLAVLDPQHQVLARAEVPNREEPAERYWPRIRAAALGLAAPWPPAAAGISFGGPVGRDGRIHSIHVGGWGDLDPAGDLAGALARPVAIENDANCGAVGEARVGAWGQPHTLVFLTCSTGIGGGIYSGGSLFRGTRGLAGEVGHIVLDPSGVRCPCGARGCFEALCSGTAIARRASAAVAACRDGRSTLVNAIVAGEIPGARPVFAAAAAGDRLAREVLDAVFADYARGIGAVQNLCDPDLIVVGGGVSLAGPALTVPVAALARQWVMADKRDLIRFEVASLGLDAQLHGAACLAADRLEHGA